MLPKNQRLPIAEFPIRSFKKYKSEYFFIKVVGNGLPVNRFAVVLGKTAVKLSTRRHMVKRQAFGNLLTWPNKGKDIFLIGNSGLSKATKGNIIQDLEKAQKLVLS